MTVSVAEWAVAFGLTVAIEAPIYVYGLRRLGLSPWWGCVLVAVALQVSTHPALWFVAPRFEPYALWLLVMESLVIAVETAGVRVATSAPWSKCFALALLANAVSTLVGLILYAW